MFLNSQYPVTGSHGCRGAVTHLQSADHEPEHLGTDAPALAQRELAEVDHQDEAVHLVLRLLGEPVQRQQDRPVNGRQRVPDGDGVNRPPVNTAGQRRAADVLLLCALRHSSRHGAAVVGGVEVSRPESCAVLQSPNHGVNCRVQLHNS